MLSFSRVTSSEFNSPCYSCDLLEEDKNNDRCLRCDARAEYALLVDERFGAPGLYIEDRISNIEIPGTKYYKPETKGVDMGYKKGTCNNCERPDMSLPGLGRCWVCYEAARNAEQSGESVEDALAAVKERVMVKKELKGRKWGRKGKTQDSRVQGVEGSSEKPQKPQIEDRTSNVEKPNPERLVSYKIPAAEPWGVMYLEFKTERDVKILEWLNKEAEDHRRRPDQEIMWILQNYIEVEAVSPQPLDDLVTR